MRALNRGAAIQGMWACALLMGCQDLDLTSGYAEVGGASAGTGGAVVGGARPSGGVAAVAGTAPTGGVSSSGVTESGTGFFGGGSSATGGSPFTSDAIGGASPLGGTSSNPNAAGSSSAPHSGGITGSGGNPATGGSSSAPSSSGSSSIGGNSATGGSSPAPSSSGSSSIGGNPDTGGSSSAPLSSGGLGASGGSLSTAQASGGSPVTGGQTASGGTSAPSGGVASSLGGTRATGGNPGTGGGPMSGGAESTGGTSSASLGGTSSALLPTGGIASTGGTPATGGVAPTGGTTNAGGTTVTETGGTSSISSSAQGGTPGSGGTTSNLEQVAINWQPACDHISTLAQSPQNLQHILVGCSNGNVWRANDGLSANPHWTRADSWKTGSGAFGLPGSSVNAIAYSPSDVNTAYIAFAGATSGYKLWKTTTNGDYWLEVSSHPLAEIWTISINPLDAQKIYTYGPGGVLMSPDDGSTWTTDVTALPMTVPIPTDAKLSTVSGVPGNPDVIWVGATNGNVFFTDTATSDQKWYQALSEIPGRPVTHLAIDMTDHDPDVFATFDGRGSDGIWVTGNNGYGWSPWHNDALPKDPQPIVGTNAFYGISINPLDRNVFYIDGTYGVGMSTSEGASWTWTNL